MKSCPKIIVLSMWPICGPPKSEKIRTRSKPSIVFAGFCEPTRLPDPAKTKVFGDRQHAGVLDVRKCPEIEKSEAENRQTEVQRPGELWPDFENGQHSPCLHLSEKMTNSPKNSFVSRISSQNRAEWNLAKTVSGENWP